MSVADKGLKKDAIGFVDGLIIGIASTAPAYSLAAVLAIVVAGVGVQAPAVLLTAFIPMFPIASEWQEARRAVEDQARAHVEGALERARAAGIDAEVALVPERPHQALLDIAAREQASFIVVGGWGEGPIRGALLGSTPYKLLHLSETPVVVVPA